MEEPLEESSLGKRKRSELDEEKEVDLRETRDSNPAPTTTEVKVEEVQEEIIEPSLKRKKSDSPEQGSLPPAEPNPIIPDQEMPEQVPPEKF